MNSFRNVSKEYKLGLRFFLIFPYVFCFGDSSLVYYFQGNATAGGTTYGTIYHGLDRYNNKHGSLCFEAGSMYAVPNLPLPSGSASRSLITFYKSSQISQNIMQGLVWQDILWYGGFECFQHYKLATQSCANDPGGFCAYGCNLCQDMYNDTMPRMNDGKWHLFAMTWDGTTLRLLLDGEIVRSDSLTITTLAGTNLRWGNPNNHKFVGCQMETAVYNHSLSVDEMKSLFLPRLPSFPNANNPVASWSATSYTWTCVSGYTGPSMTWTLDFTDNSWIPSGGPVNCQASSPTPSLQQWISVYFAFQGKNPNALVSNVGFVCAVRDAFAHLARVSIMAVRLMNIKTETGTTLTILVSQLENSCGENYRQLTEFESSVTESIVSLDRKRSLQSLSLLTVEIMIDITNTSLTTSSYNIEGVVRSEIENSFKQNPSLIDTLFSSVTVAACNAQGIALNLCPNPPSIVFSLTSKTAVTIGTSENSSNSNNMVIIAALAGGLLTLVFFAFLSLVFGILWYRKKFVIVVPYDKNSPPTASTPTTSTFTTITTANSSSSTTTTTVFYFY